MRRESEARREHLQPTANGVADKVAPTVTPMGGDGMRLEELRALVTSRFGPRLEKADAESLAQFLVEIQPLLPGTQSGGPISVDGAADSYEAAMKEYFGEVLAADPDRAAASLWITAVEMWVDIVRSAEM